MGTTTDKLNAVLDSKEAIRQAIEYRGVDIPMDTTLAEYADKIGEIPTGGTLTDEQALVFIGECAEGKRKIAKAVRNKYEGTSGTASEITEYSTFDELSNKISQIPVEVPLGNAMEQNGGVLPFYDVYNETLKAMKEFAGYGFNGVCAFELDKWSYGNDHKVTLSGADAYYTSDGTFIKDNIIYKNGKQDGELDNSLYRFQDQDAENTNRFVVYFFDVDNFAVPSISFKKDILNFFVIKGRASFVVDATFEHIFSINAFNGDLIVSNESVLQIKQNPNVRRLVLANVKEITGGTQIIYSNSNLLALSFPNLISVSGNCNNALSTNANLRIINFPNLRTINTKALVSFIHNNVKLENIYFPKLEICNNCYVAYTGTSLKLISMPNLRESTGMLLSHSVALGAVFELGNPIGGSITIALNQTIPNIKEVKIKKGFKSTLNMGYLTGLTTECIYNIIDNLSVCEGEDKNKYTITLSKSVATTEIENAVVAKGYKFAKLG